MVLIDALYICGSGGLNLLKYLVKELKKNNILFHLLADIRCLGVFDGDDVEYIKATLINRKSFYCNHKYDYSTVLCFGNIPPPISLNALVYTYFHNINLLTLKDIAYLSWKIKAHFKRWYFRYYKCNTDFWIVQTTNTKTELIKNLYEKEERVLIIPFYEISDSIMEKAQKKHGDDYSYVAYYSGSKGHDELLDAWIILHERGFDKNLHLTINEHHPQFIERIKNAQKQGVKIVNHGQLSFEKVGDIYGQSKAIIYPSLNESLGLGIVEAIKAGCDVLGSDLPFIHSICRPSVVFNPRISESIANAVLLYEEGGTNKTTLTIDNNIDKMIELLK